MKVGYLKLPANSNCFWQFLFCYGALWPTESNKNSFITLYPKSNISTGRFIFVEIVLGVGYSIKLGRVNQTESWCAVKLDLNPFIYLTPFSVASTGVYLTGQIVIDNSLSYILKTVILQQSSLWPEILTQGNVWYSSWIAR